MARISRYDYLVGDHFYGLNELLPYDQIALRYMMCAAVITPSFFTRSRFLFYVPRLIICALTEFSHQVLMVMIRRIAAMMFMVGVYFFMAFFIADDQPGPQAVLWAKAGKYYFVKNRRKICLRF
ncbi:MAG: hypothetical protein JKY50_06375 [Oleispira sp.]|nr:hypothetical protein [Oleispira sp.]MBL4882356.1 hypothetical protein [Oleispira sp.]